MKAALIAAVTAALVAAGSSFATAKWIDGHQIKRHSMPLNRLTGKLPVGAPGALVRRVR